MVDQSSATHGLPGKNKAHHIQGLDYDHRNMVRCAPGDQLYSTISFHLKPIAEHAPDAIKKRLDGIGSLIEHSAIGHDDFRVQFHLTGLPVAGSFVDRDTEMEQIEHSLLPSGPQGRRKIHVLHGLGGIGKTQLAIAYARKHQEVYSAILWVNGKSKDTLLQSLTAFATFARIDGIVVQQSTVDLTRHGQETAENAGAVLRWLALERNGQ